MSRLQRKEEETADMFLFLAKALGRIASAAALLALANFVMEKGWVCVMLALKHVGTLEEALWVLCEAPLVGETHRQRLRIVRLLIGEMPDELVIGERVVNRLVLFWMESSSISTPLSTSQSPHHNTGEPTVRIASHWSYRLTKSTSKSPLVDEVGMLKNRMDSICGADAHNDVVDSTAATIAMSMLLSVALRQNRLPASGVPETVSVPLVFVSLGGLEVLVSQLSKADERAVTLPFLEVITACSALETSAGAALCPLAQKLVHLVDCHTDHECITEAEEQSILRILTNVTHIKPTVFDGLKEGVQLACYYRERLLHPNKFSPEVISFCLCGAVNIARAEVIAHCGVFIEAFLNGEEDVLQAIAHSMYSLYVREGDTESVVMSGYHALLLGVLSLSDLPHLSLRVPVTTAVATATKDTPLGRQTEKKPMVVVVAILQEFLLFQSASGTLTKECLLEMTQIADALVTVNGIEVAVE